MGMHPTFEVRLFEDPEDAKDRERSQAALLVMLCALSDVNELWINAHKDTPSPYKAPIRYEREYGTELWADIPTILFKGYGDCEDLAMYFCAYRRSRQGRKSAAPYVKYKKVDGKYHYHALCECWGEGGPGGAKHWIEDPSKKLGMGKEAEYAELMKKRGVKPRSVFDSPEMDPGNTVGIGWGGMGGDWEQRGGLMYKPVPKAIIMSGKGA